MASSWRASFKVLQTVLSLRILLSSCFLCVVDGQGTSGLVAPPLHTVAVGPPRAHRRVSLIYNLVLRAS